MDIEAILEMYEDDYNPSSTVPGPRNMYAGGQLVQPNADGSRPGYSGKKYVEVDGTKYRIIQKGPKKNKIAFRGRNLEGVQTYEYFDNKTQIKNRIEKGKKQNIDKQIKLKSESAADVNRVRDNIDNWTKKWVKDNFNKYEIQDNNKFVEDLKKAWSKESKKNIYKLSEDVFKSGFSRWNNDSINVSDFPNFTQVQATSERTPLKIEGIFKTAGNMDTQPSSYDNFFKKTFFANKLNSDKKLKNQFNKVFDFVNKDKSKLSQKNFIKAHGSFLTNIDPDVMYMLSDDALYSTARYDLFSKTFGDSYEKYRENYIKKTNNYFKTAATIEKKLGLPNNFITNQLAAEQQLLKKVFKVKSLPPAFQYSMDHGMGLSYAASTNDKGIMKQAVNTLLGMTNAQNQALGMGGWEKNRIKLLKNVKKDSSLLPELNAHMKLGYGNILPNQETFYKIEGTGRNKKIIPTFEGQNQPDRFKSYVNQISKQTVSDIKQAFPDKTVQKSILDFKKGNTKSLNKLLTTDLLKLAGTKNKKCKGLLAYGGRVGLAEGLSPEFCLNEGKKVAQEVLFEGGGTPAQKSVARRLISAGGKMALSMLNPKELIRLSNLVGPGALGLMAAYEAGSITDDVLRLNKPLDEALAGNWLTKSFLPYSEEFAKQKNLLQSGQLTGDQKEYALEMMKMENFIKEGKRIEGLESNKLVEGTLDDDFTFTSDKDMNKAYRDLFGRFSRLKPYAYEQGITGRSLENEAAMNEYIDAQTARTGASKVFGGPQPMVNKAPRPKNMTRGPMTEKGKMKLDFNIPGYTSYDKAYTPSDDEILNIYKQQGYVHPRFGQLEPGEGTKVRMGLASQEGNRSIYGSKFMEGGIASLNVKK